MQACNVDDLCGSESNHVYRQLGSVFRRKKLLAVAIVKILGVAKRR